jgi:hypothetical protein
LGNKGQLRENELLKAKEKRVFELKEFEVQIIKSKLNLNRNKLISISSSAVFDSKGT